MFLLLVAMFTTVFFVNAEENAEEAEIAETKEVAPGNKAEEKAEIKEINAEEKAKDAQADAEIKDEGQKEVAEKVAEDKAAGKEEAEIEADEAKKKAKQEEVKIEKAESEEPKIDENKKESGSWFSWLWPFSSSEKPEKDVEDESVAQEEPAKDDIAVEEKKIQEKNEAKENVAEEIAKEEAKEVAIAEVTAEPKIEEEKKESGSWFSWLWPFSSGKQAEKTAPVADESLAEKVDPVAEKAVTKEKPVLVEEALVAEDAKNDVVAEEVVVEKAPAAPIEPVVDENADNKDKEDGSFMRAALLYIPNIFLNLSDVFSAGIGVGAEAGAQVHLTHWFQIGGQYGDGVFIEKGYDRRFGGGYDNGYSFGLIALGSEKRYVDNTFGTVEEFIIKNSKAKVFSPNDPIYANKNRDFWAVGIDAGWLINFRFDFHPIEFADFFASFIAMDITGDSLK